MAYCTLQRLIDEFGLDEIVQLSDRTGSGAVDAAVVDRAIDRAGRTIDRYLAGRVALPLSEEEVGDLACDLARFHLSEDRVPEVVQKRYDQALAELKAMASFKIGITGQDGRAAPSAGSVEMASGEKTFSRNDRSFI